MPKPRKAGSFGGSPGHHNLMMANLATELFRHGRIRTTHAKAKTVQPIAERMITLAKRGDLHSRRQVLQVIRDKEVVHTLFADVGPAFSERHGGYTRVLRLGARKGDAAPMALIELVDEVATDEAGVSTRRRWSLRRRRGEEGQERPAPKTTAAPAASGTEASDEVDIGEDDVGEDDVEESQAADEAEASDEDDVDEDVEASDEPDADEPAGS